MKSTQNKNDSKIDVAHIAQLANLPVSGEEVEKFEKQLSAIVGYIEKLNELDTKDVAATPQVTGLSNVLRDEETMPSLSQDDALSGAKNTHNGLFVVEQILEEK